MNYANFAPSYSRSQNGAEREREKKNNNRNVNIKKTLEICSAIIKREKLNAT